MAGLNRCRGFEWFSCSRDARTALLWVCGRNADDGVARSVGVLWCREWKRKRKRKWSLKALKGRGRKHVITVLVGSEGQRTETALSK